LQVEDISVASRHHPSHRLRASQLDGPLGPCPCPARDCQPEDVDIEFSVELVAHRVTDLPPRLHEPWRVQGSLASEKLRFSEAKPREVRGLGKWIAAVPFLVGDRPVMIEATGEFRPLLRPPRRRL